LITNCFIIVINLFDENISFRDINSRYVSLTFDIYHIHIDMSDIGKHIMPGSVLVILMHQNHNRVGRGDGIPFRDEAWCVGGRGFASRPWQYSTASFSSSQIAWFPHPQMPSSKS
jgi:hypothetical protein